MSLLLVAAAAATAATASAAAGPREIAAAIERLSKTIDAPSASGETWDGIKPGVKARLSAATAALAHDRQLFAIQQVGAAMPYVEAARFVTSMPEADSRSETVLEAKWKGSAALRAIRVPSAGPAALRGLAEAASLRARGYYDASLDYGRNTAPLYGLFYLGQAAGEKAFVELSGDLAQPAPPAPALRSIAAEIKALEHDLLVAYRPPLAIDRHSDFIAASSVLNEARELDAAGLRYGALVRYLDAAQRAAQLTSKAKTKEEVRQQLDSFAAKLDRGTDNSVARLYMEAAEADLDAGTAATATAIVTRVLPAYLAATTQRAAAAPAKKPLATVTLVRWPYT